MKSKNADVFAALTLGLSSDINEILDIIFPAIMSGSTEIFDEPESQSEDLFEQLFIRYLKTVASGNAYVDDFLKTLNETDCEITKLLLQKSTQQEIAGKLGINQSTVSKHIKKIQNRLLDFDPEIRKILHLFHNAQENKK